MDATMFNAQACKFGPKPDFSFSAENKKSGLILQQVLAFVS
jgi:hypothetical protein